MTIGDPVAYFSKSLPRKPHHGDRTPSCRATLVAVDAATKRATLQIENGASVEGVPYSETIKDEHWTEIR